MIPPCTGIEPMNTSKSESLLYLALEFGTGMGVAEGTWRVSREMSRLEYSLCHRPEVMMDTSTILTLSHVLITLFGEGKSLQDMHAGDQDLTARIL